MTVSSTRGEQLNIILRNTISLVTERELEEKLSENRVLRVKLGVDPSVADLHLGHAVVLRKLRQFQEFGHKVILIIGDFTARIGDPSGRSKTRPMLSKEEVEENARTYSTQAFRILDKEMTEVRFNSEWLNKLTFEELIRISSYYTVARMLERDDFEKRYEQNEPISISEFMYPLAQAYDSVCINADIEIGGDDQYFNMLVGRRLQQGYGQKSQIVMTLPLLEGTDGKAKMSKSLGNYIAFEDDPKDMYGKLMSLPDELITKYLRLLTDIDEEKIKQVETSIEQGAVNPRDSKMEMALAITEEFHGKAVARQAQRHFIEVFQKRNVPKEITDIFIPREGINIVDLLHEKCGITSRSEAKRLVMGGGVSIEGEVVRDFRSVIHQEYEGIMKIGKRRFFRLRCEV